MERVVLTVSPIAPDGRVMADGGRAIEGDDVAEVHAEAAVEAERLVRFGYTALDYTLEVR